MGTIIFTVTGLMVMTVAAYLYKRKKKPLMMNNYWDDKLTSYDKKLGYNELEIRITSLKSILFKIVNV